MDQITNYRQVMQRVLEDYAQWLSTDERVKILPVCDPVNDQYLLITLGWINGRREHDICFHAWLHEHKFMIEIDLTENGLSHQLIEAGIAAADILYAWGSPLRAQAEAALAA